MQALNNATDCIGSSSVETTVYSKN